MFKPIIVELNWNSLVINIELGKRKSEIEKILVEQNLPYISVPRKTLFHVRQIINQELPDILVVGHDQTYMDEAFISVCNSINIPTLLVQDGILVADRSNAQRVENYKDRLLEAIKFPIRLPFRLLKYITNENDSMSNKIFEGILALRYNPLGRGVVYGHGSCSKMAVFGCAVKEMLISEGVDPERIVITGNPKFDVIYGCKNTEYKQHVYDRWGIPPEREIILLITQYFVEARIWSTEQRAAFVLAVNDAISTLPNTQLIIKLHPPIENIKDYEDLTKDYPSQPVICKYTPLQELISISNLIITVSSTAALEAMAMGKCVIIVDLFNNSETSFFKDSGALYVSHKDDIRPAIANILSNPQAKNYMMPLGPQAYRMKRSGAIFIRKEMCQLMEKFVLQQAHIQDGKSKTRIANLIKEMVSDSQSPNAC